MGGAGDTAFFSEAATAELENEETWVSPRCPQSSGEEAEGAPPTQAATYLLKPEMWRPDCRVFQNAQASPVGSPKGQLTTFCPQAVSLSWLLVSEIVWNAGLFLQHPFPLAPHSHYPRAGHWLQKGQAIRWPMSTATPSLGFWAPATWQALYAGSANETRASYSLIELS